MSKVTLTQLRNITKGKLELKDVDLKFTNYIPMLKKRVIAEDVELYALEEEESVFYVDMFWFDMALGLQIARNYTNVDFSYLEKADSDTLSEKTMEFYDLLEEAGVIEAVYKNVSDAKKLRLHTQKHLSTAVKRKNSIQGSISRLLEKMPNMEEVEKTFRQVDSIDTSKMDYIKNILQYNAGEKGGN